MVDLLKRSVRGKTLCLVQIVRLILIDAATLLVCSLLHFFFAFGSRLEKTDAPLISCNKAYTVCRSRAPGLHIVNTSISSIVLRHAF